MSASESPASCAGTWPLGDRVVNRLGFGAMRLSQRGTAFDLSAEPRGRDEAIAVLRRAIELGVNHVDTAAFYFSSRRSANELICSSLSPYRDDLTIVTKVGPSRDAAGEWSAAARPEQLRGQVEENLRQLGRDELDVVNFRRQPDSPPIVEQLGALHDLRDAGLLRHVGVSGVTCEQLSEGLSAGPLVCVQNNFSLARRVDDDVLAECGRLGIAFVPFFAIAGSSGPRGPLDPVSVAVANVAAAHGATPAQVLLAWTLARGPHVLAIPGTGDLGHLEQNVAAAALVLSADEVRALEAPEDPDDR